MKDGNKEESIVHFEQIYPTKESSNYLKNFLSSKTHRDKPPCRPYEIGRGGAALPSTRRHHSLNCIYLYVYVTSSSSRAHHPSAYVRPRNYVIEHLESITATENPRSVPRRRSATFCSSSKIR